MIAATGRTRSYRISIWRYLVFWWALGPFLLVGLGLALFGDDEGRPAGFLIVLILIPFFLGWHWLVRRAWLEISPEGVRLHDFGGGMEAPWRDIGDLRVDRGHEGFITASPMESKGAKRLADYASSMQMRDERDVDLISAQRFIPIKAFAFHLREGDLRQVIAERAPHLRDALAALDAPPAPGAPLTPVQRRRNWLVAAIIVVALVATIPLIAMGERAQAWFFNVAYAVLNPLFALSSGYYAWQLLQRKNWLLGVLTLLFALVMAAWSVQTWIELQRLMHAS